MDKTFTTYRKTKTFNEKIFFRWNPFNLINKHYTRSTDQIYEVVRRILL
jgi:Mor family transcriptional regulator